MALSRSTVTYLMEEAKRRPFFGRLLTFGTQAVFISEAEVERIAGRIGLQLRPRPAEAPAPGTEISADVFFHRLGFDEVVATDVSDYEDAALVFDLNDPQVPEGHAGRYDMVLDGGNARARFPRAQCAEEHDRLCEDRRAAGPYRAVVEPHRSRFSTCSRRRCLPISSKRTGRPMLEQHFLSLQPATWRQRLRIFTGRTRPGGSSVRVRRAGSAPAPMATH